MSLIQEFIQEQINKNPSSIIIEQIQNCHSSVQDLLINMQYFKDRPKIQQIDDKLTKLSIFQQAKQKIFNIIQKIQPSNISQYLCNESSIIKQIIHKQKLYVNEMIYKLIKRIFLSDETLEEYLSQMQIVNLCITSLNTINDDLRNNKNPNREKIRLFDVKNFETLERVKYFEQKIQIFNLQVNSLIEQLYSFQSLIINQFKFHFVQIVQPTVVIYNEQPSYQHFQSNQPLPHESDIINRPIMARTAQQSGFGQQRQSSFTVQTSQNWRVTKPNKDNQISKLGLQSKISINNFLPINEAKRDSKLSKFNDLSLRSTFQAK